MARVRVTLEVRGAVSAPHADIVSARLRMRVLGVETRAN